SFSGFKRLSNGVKPLPEYAKASGTAFGYLHLNFDFNFNLNLKFDFVLKSDLGSVPKLLCVMSDMLSVNLLCGALKAYIGDGFYLRPCIKFYL
ncbi:MAG: hypothetical protein SOZ78_08490, partial [Eubacteriales bacterium]|nr:hypothetical protein [Eubacteriales bacterium]